MLGEPSLLLLDEPTNGLDPFWVNNFITLINELKKAGTIIMFSTHMMDIAAEAGDHILFLKKGEAVQQMKNTLNKEEMTLKLLELHRQI